MMKRNSPAGEDGLAWTEVATETAAAASAGRLTALATA
jgi:hypothetical protein